MNKNISDSAFLKLMNQGILFLIWMATCIPATGFADSITQRRVLAGLDLFPSFLAANQDIREKQTPDGELLLMLISSDINDVAAKSARHLKTVRHIRGIPTRLKLISDEAFLNYDGPVPAGIFLLQNISSLKPIIRYSYEHHTMLISPVDGDVERGVMGGIHISDRILPHVNMKAVKKARIRIKPFFLRISKKYE